MSFSKKSLAFSAAILASSCTPKSPPEYVPVAPVSEKAWTDYTQQKVASLLENPKYKEQLSSEELRILETYLEEVYKTSFSFSPESTLAEIMEEVISRTGDARFRIKPLETQERIIPITGYPEEWIHPINNVFAYAQDPENPQTIIFIVQSFRRGLVAEPVREILKKHGPDQIFFDFRENKGGSTPEKTALLEIFLKEGLIADFKEKGLVYAQDDEGELDEYELERPCIVFTSSLTASSAESFIWALKQQNLAITCGEETFGKWSKNLDSSQVLPGYSVKVTIDRHKGKKELAGISPDIPNSFTETPPWQVVEMIHKGSLSVASLEQ